MIKILDEGFIVRNRIHNYKDDKMNHVCLYKKNDNYDYNIENDILHSARGGWIDRQFIFIIKPNIAAHKAEVGKETNIVDEWRSIGNILPTDFVGIALPFKELLDYLNENINSTNKEENETIRQYLPILIDEAKSMGLTIMDSTEINFTDKFDSTLREKTNIR